MNCDWAYTGNTIANGFKEVRCTRCGLVGYSPYPLTNIINPVGCAAPGIPRPNVPPPEHGPGTEIEKIIATFNSAGCGTGLCHQHALEMNQRGPQWCRDNRETIIGWLKESAALVSAFDKATAVGVLIQQPWFNPFDPFGSMVDEAISRADR